MTNKQPEPFDVTNLRDLTPLERKRAAEEAIKAETRKLPHVDHNGQPTSRGGA